jgi:acyl-CoA synthetase (AMP-forming)/AMP-acid ligase II/MFS family permease/acyl carrier protein
MAEIPPPDAERAPDPSAAANLAEQIRRGRMLFIAMAVAYTLGNFNDNFNKQAVSLLALSHHHTGLPGVITILFTVPFLLFYAAAGWLADRFPRRNVIIISKVMELVFLGLGGVGIMTLNWPLIVAVIFLMALQATIFGPALSGCIPDVYPESYVVHANARLTSATTAGILLGVVAAGLALNLKGTFHGLPLGRLVAAGSLVGVSVLGLLVSFGVPYRPAGNPQEPFPWAGPWSSLEDLWDLRTDGLLTAAVITYTYFWFIAGLQILFINKMGKVQFGLNDATTSYLALAEMLGVVIGAMAAGKVIARDNGLWVTPGATAALGLFLCLSGLAPFLPEHGRIIFLLSMLACAGVAGGLMMVPLGSFFQTRPAPQKRGRVIAAAGFASSVGLLAAGIIYIPLQKYLQSSTIFILMGLLTLPAALAVVPFFGRRKPGRPRWAAQWLCLVVRRVLALRYRVSLKGVPQVKARGTQGILFLPNHPALIDPVIVLSYLHGTFGVRPLALENQINKPLVRPLADLLGVLPIPDMSSTDVANTNKAQQAIELCIEALARGENVLLYPAGRIMRQQVETLGGVSAVYRILARLPDIRVVLVRTTGLWGSGFGWAAGTPPQLGRGLMKHIPSLLANGVCFAPKREVRMELVEPADLPRRADKATLNGYLDAFYNQAAPPALYVPYSRWEKGGRREMPPRPSRAAGATAAEVPPATREMVLDYLREVTGVSNLQDHQQLARDVGLDSLATAEIIFWLEKEFAVQVPSVEAVHTVGDVLMAACGKLAGTSADTQVPPAPARWLAQPARVRAHVPAGTTVQEVFLAQAGRNPGRVIVADMQHGVRTYRDMMTSILALQPKIAAMPGQYVGILLPASVAADITFLAVLFAGKTPVMVNWTAGQRNVRHGLDLLEVQKVLTAEALVRRLSAQGIDLTALQDRLVPLEGLAASMSVWEKLAAAVRARFSWRALRRCTPTPNAVVLFTSGSEALPKAVPLTHTNLLTNIRDALESFTIWEGDRFLGMLPPFHSFGITATMLLPLLAGVKVVHYPNPNEGATLAKIIPAYRVTILLATPTFVANIVRCQGCDLTSVRLCVTGAERCPQELREALKISCPRAVVLEGYGITECSPFVAVVREDDLRPGTIGKPLPSVTVAVVHPDTGQAVGPDETGMLLVRGPSIFGGYLHYDGPCPFEPWNGQIWYRTGDLVKADAQGRLTFVGRLKRFVKIGGEMISLPAIEEVLGRAYGRPEDKGPCLAVLPTPDESYPELVLLTIRPLDRAQVNQAIGRAGLSGLHNIRIVRQVEQIPVLGTGKTDYQTLARLLSSAG